MKNVSKPLRGHFEKTGGGVPPTRILKEIRLTGEPEAAVGDQIKVDLFADGDKVEVVGRSKGRGFAGTIKRHNFSRGPESHGSMSVRAPGSIGQSAYPSRVIKGTKSSGHMNADELQEQADALKESLFRLKFRKSLGVGDTVKDIRREKKTLARVYTLLKNKEAEANNA